MRFGSERTAADCIARHYAEQGGLAPQPYWFFTAVVWGSRHRRIDQASRLFVQTMSCARASIAPRISLDRLGTTVDTADLDVVPGTDSQDQAAPARVTEDEPSRGLPHPVGLRALFVRFALVRARKCGWLTLRQATPRETMRRPGERLEAATARVADRVLFLLRSLERSGRTGGPDRLLEAGCFCCARSKDSATEGSIALLAKPISGGWGAHLR
jgi:hypothetical protein